MLGDSDSETPIPPASLRVTRDWAAENKASYLKIGVAGGTFHCLLPLSRAMTGPFECLRVRMTSRCPLSGPAAHGSNWSQTGNWKQPQARAARQPQSHEHHEHSLDHLQGLRRHHMITKAGESLCEEGSRRVLPTSRDPGGGAPCSGPSLGEVEPPRRGLLGCCRTEDLA